MDDSSSSSQDEGNVLIRYEVKKTARRGPTIMPELIHIRNSGERKTIEYNDLGQPVGENAKKMQSFIGVCVRQQIPLTYKSWKAVPQELKDTIFDCIQMSFVVDLGSKHYILQSASKKFRTFKSTLTQQYILPYKDEPSRLQNPPEKYSHIDKKQWESFVKARLSEEWETFSSAQRERRAKCIYNHHISRKGYANLAQELELSSDPCNRATLWKEARKRKNNEYSDIATRECAKRIDELAAIRKGQDILTEALGTPEHRGRIRGVGEFVSPALHYNVAKGKLKLIQESQNEAETQQSQDKDETQQSQDKDETRQSRSSVVEKKTKRKRVQKGRNVQKRKKVPKGKMVVKDPEEILEGIPCHLAIGSVDNIVAVGTMFESDAQCPSINEIPLGPDNVRAMVDIVMGEDVALPIPQKDKIKTLDQAIGNFVAWPRKLVITTKEKKAPSPTTSKSIAQSSKYTDVHVTIKLLNRYAMHSMQVDDMIQINLSEQILGKEKTIYLQRDDIIQYCGMAEIGYSCILAYIACLWNACDSEITKKFVIVDQATISSHVKPQELRSKNLINRLEMVSLDQLVLIPYNTGCHWILIIINLQENCVYVMDSLRSKILEEFQGVINTSLKNWQAKHSLEQYRTRIRWKPIKCPRQFGAIECGYYVQKYIREIVQNSNTHISNLFNTRLAYEQKEIDAVRLEWAEFVARFV
ncbi:uncharacterized protein LOC120084092 isoform X2 [Benincasa hispida]|uniref:uncharacterized protein LOC120084092 isoform X2 n=1 Tax=Benincasa hispida TaxID=102211 RepID=UPI001901C876|nr:uncharacterized protein LOC120084092 isoform X2 [Benincasa hispida]